MAKSDNLPSIVDGLYKLLEPLNPDDRARVVRAVLALLGEGGISAAGTEKDKEFEGDSAPSTFGAKATRWMTQNKITEQDIYEIFHKDGDSVDVIASSLPGNGKRGETRNCYLLSGARALLETDEPKFSEPDVVYLCKLMGCHDRSNHSAIRRSLGNMVAGTKTSGYTLPAPGLRAAAELIKEMASEAQNA